MWDCPFRVPALYLSVYSAPGQPFPHQASQHLSNYLFYQRIFFSKGLTHEVGELPHFLFDTGTGFLLHLPVAPDDVMSEFGDLGTTTLRPTRERFYQG